PLQATGEALGARPGGARLGQKQDRNRGADLLHVRRILAAPTPDVNSTPCGERWTVSLHRSLEQHRPLSRAEPVRRVCYRGAPPRSTARDVKEPESPITSVTPRTDTGLLTPLARQLKLTPVVRPVPAPILEGRVCSVPGASTRILITRSSAWNAGHLWH